MIIIHDPRCADYGSSMRPEQPARITRSADHLRSVYPDWTWRAPTALVTDETLLLAHTPAFLKRLGQHRDFDADTPYLPDIAAHARRAVSAALTATELALAGERAFALMRPPGHHATASQAMGFCYLNQIAIAALAARTRGTGRVAIWDFDAHHGNGTEALLHGRDGLLFTSVHQSPGYPGTGTESFDNCHNWPIAPHLPRARHMAALRESLDAVIAFRPDLILVSAGFDAYAHDPLTAMTLEIDDFATLGTWLRTSGRPAAALLEGGYSDELPLLIAAFLAGWENAPQAA
ncbi:MAG: Acetoin utilization deacetylase AcuC [Verrucomicrobia bacterium]|jgi:acetoin utilization deacetylase AcuC-like enzyme|nr:MAG: Acetoin utilization deacetylase AcuC [Verrucomicrobiota bacterium]